MSIDWIEYSEEGPHPLVGEDFLAFTDSVRVLVVNNKRIYTAELRVYPPEDNSPPVWVQTGPDGYTLDKVTHWAYLPDLPESMK